MSVFLRLLFVIPQAAIVTCLLLTLMISLIAFADKDLNQEQRIKLADIFMPEMELEVQRIIEKPVKPELDETPPPDTPKQDFDTIDTDSEIGQVTLPDKIKPKLDLNIGGLQVTDGEYLPIVKVAPQYPRRALRKGVEGYVILEYTVTKAGTVKDPTVIESFPQGVFDKSAIKSALRYKYKPRVVEGQAIEVSGVRTKIRFQIEKS